MKTLIPIFLLFATSTLLTAQEVNLMNVGPASNNPNIVKTNLWSVIFYQNINIGYERVLGDNISVLANINLKPAGQPWPIDLMIGPFSEGDDDAIKDWQVSGFSFAPEFRLYTSGKKDAPYGFYIGPFLRYSTNSLDIVFEQEYLDQFGATQTVTLPFEGKLKQLGGGIQIGWQFKVGERIVLDWWALGPSYYASTMDATIDLSSLNLPDADIIEIEGEYNTGLNDIPFVKATTNVSSDEIKTEAKFPLLGIRSGFSIGVSF